MRTQTGPLEHLHGTNRSNGGVAAPSCQSGPTGPHSYRKGAFYDQLHRRADQFRGPSRVDRHVHGTGLTGVLPGSWDHPIATDGTTRRVVAGARVVAGFGSIHVERCGGPVWRFGRLM